jgi:hypothetical protein
MRSEASPERACGWRAQLVRQVARNSSFKRLTLLAWSGAKQGGAKANLPWRARPYGPGKTSGRLAGPVATTIWSAASGRDEIRYSSTLRSAGNARAPGWASHPAAGPSARSTRRRVALSPGATAKPCCRARPSRVEGERIADDPPLRLRLRYAAILRTPHPTNRGRSSQVPNDGGTRLIVHIETGVVTVAPTKQQGRRAGQAKSNKQPAPA